MTQSDKTVRDGVMLVASYHFLLAILSVVGALAIVIFALLPNFSETATSSGSIFMPVVGIIVGIFLGVFYGVTGSGLIQLKNSARMGAVFLALFGTIGGLFILIGAGVPTVRTLLPDVAAVAGVIVAGLCGYFLLTILDITVLVFLFNRRVRALFYGEPYVPERHSDNFSRKIRSAFIDEDVDEEYETERPVRATPQRVQPKKEVVSTPVQRQHPPEELDTPGDLFTEPTPTKK